MQPHTTHRPRPIKASMPWVFITTFSPRQLVVDIHYVLISTRQNATSQPHPLLTGKTMSPEMSRLEAIEVCPSTPPRSLVLIAPLVVLHLASKATACYYTLEFGLFTFRHIQKLQSSTMLVTAFVEKSGACPTVIPRSSSHLMRFFVAAEI